MLEGENFEKQVLEKGGESWYPLPSKETYKSSQDSQHTALSAVVFSYHGMNTYTTHLFCSQQAQTQKVGVPGGGSMSVLLIHTKATAILANRLTLLNFAN